MAAITVDYYWGDCRNKAELTWSDGKVMEVIEDLIKAGAKPRLAMYKIKREISDIDLSKGVKSVDFEDFEGKPRRLVILTRDGIKYELKEKYRRC